MTFKRAWIFAILVTLGISAGTAEAGWWRYRRYPRVYYVTPAPVYVQPYPVYVQPVPGYVRPGPVYLRPAPVYGQPLPAAPLVPVSPAPVTVPVP